MNGSTSLTDRLFLLEKVDKIIFNSMWSRDRFFLNLDKNELIKKKTTICYQSSSRCFY